MRTFISKYHQPLFYGAWLLVNLIQAGGTGLFDDEAYYWVYSQFPAWGYFDHPPMIAWLIKAGYSIFQNELGLRLFIVIIHTASIFIIQQLTQKKDAKLFYAIAASILVAQIGGIIAVPDIPLLFFISLFFWLYDRYIAGYSLIYASLLGCCMALMLYSKYHAVLIILFTLISNPKLFAKYQSYIAAAITIILFFPHLYWQYAHGFPSVQFHLFERNAVHYRSSFTFEYLAGQLALAGPIAGWLLLWAAFRYKPGSLTQKGLQYALAGLYSFFLLSTWKGRVEANWTVPAYVGLIVLSHQYLANHARLRRILYYTVPLSLLLALAARIYMLLNIPASPSISKDEFHGNQTTATIVKQKVGDLPLVVIDSYQKPSKYWFYTGRKAMALNTIYYRRNNYNYWPIEDELIGKAAYVVGPKDSFFLEPIGAPAYKNNGGTRVDVYYSFSRIMIRNMKKLRSGKATIEISCIVEAPENYFPLFKEAHYGKTPFYLVVYNDRGDPDKILPTNTTLSDLKEKQTELTIACTENLAPGKYKARLAIGSCIPGRPSMNSTAFGFVVE